MKLKFVPFLLLALIVLPMSVVLAASPSQVPTPTTVVDLLTAALQVLTALVGYPAAVAAAAAIALKLGAPAAFVDSATNIVNLVVFLGVAYLLATGQGGLITVIDNALGGIAKLLADIVIVLGGFAATRVNTSHYLTRIASHSLAFEDARSLLRR